MCVSMRQRVRVRAYGMCMRDKVCVPAGRVCVPAPRLGAEAVIPVRVPAGGSQQSSISHCWARTSVSVWLCLLLLPLLLSPSALADRA